ncbi:MAG: hypothetical protein HY749_14040 [Gammaproteobacteria bacterium]|nr:hypothetical protein [Gammaproteobacteria bacterium]MBI5616268.1 hypothetical protein [Gammaproteobacteria bacterium]
MDASAAGIAKRAQPAAASPAAPAAQAAPNAPDPLTQAQAVLAGLSPASSTHDLAHAARGYGSIVDAARGAGVSDGYMKKLVHVTTELHKLATGKLMAIEDEAGDNEGALEQLYRSAAWDDLSFAMAAFPYWRSWLELTLAERSTRGDERIRLLKHARRGFRAASLQIFQPSLVYGGWLGLGFVAIAEGNRPRAISIFENLDTALAGDPGHPVKKAVGEQLRLMRENKAPTPIAAPAGANDAFDAGRLRAEAFALLERQRATQAGGREGVAKLRQLIDAGLMEMTLLSDILGYQKEVVREDLGIWGELVGAEFAFTSEQYYTAVQKYQKFFAQEPGAPGMNFDRFRYRHAVACLKSNLTDQAATLGEKLLRNPKLEAELRNAAIKLVYIARAQREQAKGTPESQQALQQAAQRFLSANPGDPDADGARLILAQSSGDTTTALKLLGSVKRPDTLGGGVQTARFFLIAREFAKFDPGASTQYSGIARQGMNAFDELPAEEKRNPENYAAYLQMRAVSDTVPEDVVKAIDLAERKGDIGSSARKALLWARIRCYERLGQPERLAAWLQQPGTGQLEGWQLELVYPWVKALPDGDVKRMMTASLKPLLANLPDMDRRFRLMEITSLLADRRNDEAYEAAAAFNKQYPKAGDGWVQLARTARLTNRTAEAESAWKVITDRTDADSAVWQEGMLARIEMKSESTDPQAACPLVADVKAHPPKAPPEFTAQIAVHDAKLGCTPAAKE